MDTRLGPVEAWPGIEVMLVAPDTYWNATPSQRQSMCNGCGAAGSGWTIPDTMYGLNITVACDCHDVCYLVGSTIFDKEQADREFLNNLIRLIESAPSGKWPIAGAVLSMLRRRRALKYYEAVRIFGGPAFWGS